MPELANNVSSGLSPLLRIAKTGKSETTADAEIVRKNDSAFSRDLDQARQQQLNKTQAGLPQRGSGKDSSQATAARLNHSVPSTSPAQASGSNNSRLIQDSPGDDSVTVPSTSRAQASGSNDSRLIQDSPGDDSVTVPSTSRAQASESNDSRLIQDSPGDDSVTVDIAGRLVAIKAEESAIPLQATTSQSLSGAVKQGSALPAEPQPTVKMSATDNADPKAAQLPEQQSVAGTVVVPPVLSTVVEPGNGTVGEVVTPATLVSRSSQSSSDLQATSAAESGAAALSGGLGQAHQQPLNKTQAELLQRGSGKGSSQAPGARLNHSMPSTSRSQASGPDEIRLLQDSPGDDSVTVDVAGRPVAIKAEESAIPLQATTSQASSGVVKQGSALPADPQLTVKMSATDNADPKAAQLPEQQSVAATVVVPPVLSSGIESVNGAVGVVVTPATLAVRSRQLFSGLQPSRTAEPDAADGLVASANPSAAEGLHATTGRLSREPVNNFAVRKPATEQDATLASAARMAKGAVHLSGEAGSAVITAPEAPVSGQIDKTPVPRTNVVQLTQVASGNGIVTQATLAGRFRNLNSNAASPGTETTQKANDIRLAPAVQPSLTTKGLDSLPTDDMPLANERMSGMASLGGITDSNATVHQRIATAEAVLSQMALEADDTSFKMPAAPAADNLLQAISGSTTAAPVATQSVPVAGPVLQAPLNIPLASVDAETALASNVKWMTNEGVKNAVMTVTPHGMGPISVKIAIEGGQMDVSIIASQHSTRDALESMLPRLREQLAVQGHDTVKVDVSDGKSEQSRSGNGQAFAESRNPAGTLPQDNQSNSRNQGEKTGYGRTDDLEVVSESFMAEDLQRVAARAVGEAGSRPVFDAYV